MRFQRVSSTLGPLPRGLYIMPVTDANGHVLVYAVTSQAKLTPRGVVAIPWGASVDAMEDILTAELDEVDPATDDIRRGTMRVG